MWPPLFTYFGLSYWFIFVPFPFTLAAAFELQVYNNGPGILDSKITFFAEVVGEDLLNSYIFEFEDNVFKSHNLVVQDKRKAKYPVLYSTGDNVPGTFEMKVKLYRSFIVFHELIAEKITKFTLTEFINGNLTVTGGKELLIPVGKPVNVTFNLRDQSGFFDGASINYVWEVDGSRHVGMGSVLTYNATKPGSVEISLIINAMVPKKNSSDSLVKWGFFDMKLQALNPISNVTVIGNVFLQQGDIVTFEVSCNGSGPYHYCWKLYPPNGTLPNMSCVDPIVTTRCNFPYMHFFPDAGVHWVGVVIGNALNTVNRTVELHINDVSKKAQLSTVIIPIVCSLMGIVIVVAGIAFHIHQRKKYSIEVADFDFQIPSEPLVEKTFLERLKDSFKQSIGRSDQTEVKMSPGGDKLERKSSYGSTCNLQTAHDSPPSTQVLTF